MADKDSAWLAQNISDGKLNVVSSFHGTTLPATNFPIDALFLLEGTGIYRNTGTFATPVWTSETTSGKSGDQQYPLSVTIGDYSIPVAAVISSNSSGIAVGMQEGGLKLGNGTGGTGFSGAPAEERGFRLNGLSGAEVKTCKVLLRKVGAPTGNIQLEIFNSIIGDSRPSGEPIANGTSGTLDVSTLTTLFAVYTFTWTTPPSIGTNHWIVAHYTGGSGTNYVEIGGVDDAETNDPCFATDALHSSDYFNSPATDDIVFEAFNSTPARVDSFLPAANMLKDDSITTTWTSLSENNPNCHIDTGVAQEVVAIAIHLDRTLTTETQIKIRASTDTIFTDGETVRLINIVDFTDDTWRFIALPRLDIDKRYIQIFGVGTSKVLSINEIKYRAIATATINRSHFHRYVSPTSVSDNLLDSN